MTAADVTPEHINALARVLHEFTDGVGGEGTAGWPERNREVYALAIEEVADAIAGKPSTRAALAAALTDDELTERASTEAMIRRLVERGALTERKSRLWTCDEFGVRKSWRPAAYYVSAVEPVEES